MDNNEKADELVQQPFMSTGTTMPGFDRNIKKSQPAAKPKIGATIIGDDESSGQLK
ncbi:hypothetical protein RCG24_06185 [Neobacillus sp. OS1-32]|uniref:hypothetical protein n=1 Tax=Neobacillus sp. OS1-32 TaxID=3070682 RepID=UPI0027E190E1|nr:hypothetical protein [Neobacillus sp. OS1-32]WML31451.1 hypothetical protein RCG24_06185 [Neobacillus sp. OS1-32]